MPTQAVPGYARPPSRSGSSGKVIYSSSPRRGMAYPPAPRASSPAAVTIEKPNIEQASGYPRPEANRTTPRRPERSNTPSKDKKVPSALLSPMGRPSSLTRCSSGDRNDRRVGSPFTPRGQPASPRRQPASPLRRQSSNPSSKCSTPRLPPSPQAEKANNASSRKAQAGAQSSPQAQKADSHNMESQQPSSKGPTRMDASTLQWLEDVLRPQPNCRFFVLDRLALRSLPKGDCDDVLQTDIEFGEMLGAGSFGAVWRGRYRGQEVAVKQCHCGDERDTQMLLEEIRCLQSLHHPALVSYKGGCKKLPHVLMLLEYMEGGSLDNLLFKKKQRLEFNDKARMAYEISAGLVYIHSLGVVHRDLKTANIVLDSNLRCKICDFGMTLMLENTHITVHKLEGSPRYMAPEQLQEKGKITDKCDIWQFGCVLLELFCLVKPFAQCTGVQQIYAELLVRKKPPPVPSEADPRARQIVGACLRIQAANRPAAAALKKAICGAWKGRAEAENECLADEDEKTVVGGKPLGVPILEKI